MEKDVVRFSFIMPAYKSKYLKQAIDSILSQEYINFELIIVNDASPEKLFEVIHSYNDDRIRYYENKVNIGGTNLIKNWNKCIGYAKGKYLILASDDDVYMKDFLKEIHELIVRYPHCNVLRSRVQRINSIGIITGKDFMYPEFMSQSEFIYYWSRGMIKCISNYVFRRNYFEEKGMFIQFPLAWFSDDATVVNMSKVGVVSTQEILFSFRSSDINISTQNSSAILKKKLNATVLFYNWILSYLNNNNLLTNNYLNPAYNIHKYLYDMILKMISKMSLINLVFVLRYLFQNNILYKKEKLYVLINYIFRS